LQEFEQEVISAASQTITAATALFIFTIAIRTGAVAVSAVAVSAVAVSAVAVAVAVAVGCKRGSIASASVGWVAYRHPHHTIVQNPPDRIHYACVHMPVRQLIGRA
jgi:hypothetical protein